MVLTDYFRRTEDNYNTDLSSPDEASPFSWHLLTTSIFPLQETPKLAKGTTKPSSSGKDGGGESAEEVMKVGTALVTVQAPARTARRLVG